MFRRMIAALSVVLVALLFVFACVAPPSAAPISGNINGSAQMIQGHACDPGKSVRKKPANTIYQKGSGGNVDITGWTSMEVYPTTANGNVMFNNITTATVFTGQRNTIIIHPATTSIKIDTEHHACGM